MFRKVLGEYKLTQCIVVAILIAVALGFYIPFIRFNDQQSFTPEEIGITPGEEIMFTLIENVPVRRGIYTLELQYSSPDGSKVSVRSEQIRVRNTYLSYPAGENTTYSNLVYIDSSKGLISLGLENGAGTLQLQRLTLRYSFLLTMGYYFEHLLVPLGICVLAVMFCFGEWILALRMKKKYFIPALIMTVTSFLCRALQYSVDVNWSEYIRLYPRDTIFSWLFYYFSFLSTAVLLRHVADSFVTHVSAPTKTQSAFHAVRERLCRWAYQGPFRMSLIIILIAWAPCTLLSYPAHVLNGDTVGQIGQALGIYPLANDHPVMHTLLLRFWLYVGYIIHSYNFGLYLFCVCQVAVLASIMAYSISIMIRTEGTPVWLWMSMLLYYALHPRIQPFAVLVTKDVYYAAFMLLLLTALYCLLKNGRTKHSVIVVILSVIGMLAFRHEGIYVVFFTLLFLPQQEKWRRLRKIAFPCLIALFLLLLPALYERIPALRVAFTIPYQQTARYINYYPDDVTAEEQQALSAVFDYEKIAGSYNPNQADGIFRALLPPETSATRAYLSAWFSMGRRHPEVYAKAFLYNKGKCLYPAAMFYNNYIHEGGMQYVELGMPYNYKNTDIIFGRINDELFGGEPYFSSSEKVAPLKRVYEGLRESVLALPVVELLAGTFFYIWGTFLWAFTILNKRTDRKGAFVPVVPVLAQVFSRLTDTCNGDMFRYSFSFVVCVPAMIIFSLLLLRDCPIQMKRTRSMEKRDYLISAE